jgi:hypothetical protein
MHGVPQRFPGVAGLQHEQRAQKNSGFDVEVTAELTFARRRRSTAR